MLSKKPKVKKIRNVLQSPFHISWDNKEPEELKPVENALTKLLPSAKLEKVHNPRSTEIHKKSSNEGCEVKKRQENIYRSLLALGYQSVIRGLEKRELCCILLCSEVEPRLMLKVVLAQARARDVPVVLMPNLRAVTICALGFSSIALGFKNSVSESSHNIFHPIYRLICDNPTVLRQNNVIKHEVAEMSVDENDTITKTTTDQRKVKSVYLYREQFGKRAFIPGYSNNKNITVSNSGKTLGDFISLGMPSKQMNTTGHLTCKHLLPNISKVKINDFDIDCEDDDDDNDSSSNSENDVFFVDNKPDQSLLSTQEKKLGKNNITYEKQNSKTKDQKSFNHKTFGNQNRKESVQAESTNSGRQNWPHQLKPGKSKKDKYQGRKPKFHPLSVNMISGNLNSIKKSKKKKKKINNLASQNCIN